MNMSSVAAELRGIGRSVQGPDGDRIDILRGVDVTVHVSEFVALVGPSGSGKSTLLNVLGLLDQPTFGRYELGGTDVTGASERVRTRLRAAHLSFIFQSFHLAADKTVSENVELGLACQGVRQADRRRRTADMLEAVGMSHRSRAYRDAVGGRATANRNCEGACTTVQSHLGG